MILIAATGSFSQQSGALTDCAAGGLSKLRAAVGSIEVAKLRRSGRTDSGSECFRIPDFGNLTMKLFGELRGLALAVATEFGGVKSPEMAGY